MDGAAILDRALYGGEFRNEPMPAGGGQRHAEYDRHGLWRDFELLFGSGLYFCPGYGGGGCVHRHRDLKICQLYIITLVATPIPASTESEIPPAMRLRTMAEITASPFRNKEDEPTERDPGLWYWVPAGSGL